MSAERLYTSTEQARQPRTPSRATNCVMLDLRQGILWLKKASDVKTDITETEIRDTGLSHGLVDVKVCAVDETWSDLKFVYRKKDR